MEEDNAALQNKFILWFDEIGKDDIALVGGKNANLGELYQNLTLGNSKLFPEEKNIVNLESQLKGKINAYDLNSKNTNFASVFALTISVMTKVGNKDDIHLKQFRYDQESGELKIGFDASSITLLDKIKKNLTDSDMSVEIVSANEENGVIKATLSIKHV